MQDPPPPPDAVGTYNYTQYPVIPLSGGSFAAGFGLYHDLGTKLPLPKGMQERGTIRPTYYVSERLEYTVRSDWANKFGDHARQYWYFEIEEWGIGRGESVITYATGLYKEVVRRRVTVRYRLCGGGMCWSPSAGCWVSPEEWGDSGPGNPLLRLARYLPAAHDEAARELCSSAPPDCRRKKQEEPEEPLAWQLPR
ncbi:hypothetical protein CHLRE_13g582950v5 [Chlamydomonas reinhardtii]|uniref:Uncharacterized protein n=1 Tax=Chlamydomonas reinhardtii TaxID=3055 RepID=A8HU39_CHLRE|nr:uncharacterized protein CHLRE_13g582950v5 [Chlamydomonas reinhardtii]PNW74040.1 hypothetical protein CHLRE_13g582950v5 [Chlamydomonas reinhardtii]|eukprot:XP_001693590.1 hypothetical protein CHLREDRAFT_205688 [Chlamydomonas reinhardtii]